MYMYIYIYRYTFGFGMLCRCFRICSNLTQFYTELNLLKGMFHKKRYLKNVIGKCFKKVFN